MTFERIGRHFSIYSHSCTQKHMVSGSSLGVSCKSLSRFFLEKREESASRPHLAS